MLSLRIIQRKVDCCTWETVRMSQLRDGDVFRIFDRLAEGADLVRYKYGDEDEWTVKGEPRKRDDGIWEVSTRVDG